MHCSKCGAENPDRAKFCGECASPLTRRCSSCDTENSPTAKFCIECAKPLESVEGKSQRTGAANSTIREGAGTSDASLEGERKTVTALFADIKGSMELIEDLDPEEARAIVDPALKLMMEAVQRYGGYVSQSTGDGIFALFGAPVAHEDHPQRALYAAVRMQEELKRYSDRIRAEGRLPIQARVGVNTGEVVVRSITTGEGRTEYAPVGHSTGIAARMQALAPIGSIAATEQVRKLCEGYFVFHSLGPTKVKGVSEPVNVYEVTGLGLLRTRLQRAAGRGYTKFVGRNREMDAMKAAAEQARAGHGQIVAAMAEPGVGKSRLIFEFKAVSQSGWLMLEAVSVSYGKASAFLPVIDLLWNYFKISSDDDERTRREKVNGKVLTLDRSLEEVLPYLNGLLGISDENNQIAEIEAQTRKRRALDAIKRIILSESLNQPLILTFEDLHWIDSESQAFLNLLADSIGTARILLLVNYRPEYRHEWGHKTYYTQLRLDPLGKESANDMLSALLGDGKDLTPLKHLLIDKTEGNPLFMEEIVQALFEEETLKRNGAVKITRSLNQLKIPPTVQDILASRIDRLAPDRKDLLQTLSIIGTEFKLGLVSKVAVKPGPELEPMLSELQLGEFIYEQPAVGEVEYTFKHALTQQVAYNSVLNERRRVQHERIGAALESIYAESLDDHLAELAHHYARSGNPAKGVEYCLRAVLRSVDRGSYAEALALFETGLELLQKLPADDQRAELELDLRNAASMALMWTKGYASPEAEQLSARAMQLCQRPGIDWEKAWFPLRGVFLAHFYRPDLRKACEIATELVARAEQGGSTEHIAVAGAFLAQAKMYSGDFELAAQGFDRHWALLESIAKLAPGPAQTRASPTPPQWQRALNRITSAWNLWFLGYPGRALQRVSIATAIANESGSKSVLNYVHDLATYIYELRREPEHMRERAEAMRVLSTELGDIYRLTQGEIYLGWANSMAGDLGGGIERMRHQMLELKAVGSETHRDYFLALIATALGGLGRFDEGLRTIDESFPFIERSDERLYEAEVHRLKGELLLAQDASNAAQAEQSFRTAIEIARRQKAKSWELRATTSIARLLGTQGRCGEARAMLADIYNWFTEDFDTTDLKEAKALLDKLGGSP